MSILWHLTIHREQMPILYTRFAATSDKVYQLLAHGRCFSPDTPASSTTKTDRGAMI
jgi:hypothetical protein